MSSRLFPQRINGDVFRSGAERAATKSVVQSIDDGRDEEGIR
jgi:hypothetical protein